jgi:hypothetical protein
MLTRKHSKYTTKPTFHWKFGQHDVVTEESENTPH